MPDAPVVARPATAGVTGRRLFRLLLAALVVGGAMSMVAGPSRGNASSDGAGSSVDAPPVSIPPPTQQLAERFAETKRQWAILKEKRERRRLARQKETAPAEAAALELAAPVHEP